MNSTPTRQLGRRSVALSKQRPLHRYPAVSVDFQQPRSRSSLSHGYPARTLSSSSKTPFCPDGDESWMKDPEHPKLHQFLKTLSKPRFRRIERAFYQEFRRRLPREDSTIPECIGSFEYYMRQNPGENFPVYYRKRRDGHGEEQVVLDQNQNPMLHQDFHFIVAMKISPDEKSMLLVQENAHEEYRVVLRRFNSGSGSGSRKTGWFGSGSGSSSVKASKQQLQVLEHLGQVRNVEWCSNNTFYFTSVDQQRRPHAVYRYDLRTQQLDKYLIQPYMLLSGEQVFDEPDQAFFVDVSSTKDNAFVLINCNSKNTSEIYALPCGEELPASSSEPVLLRKREPNTSYFVDHAAGRFYIVTNADQAVNYKIAVCDDPPVHADWSTLIPETQDVKIEDVDLFEKFLVIYERVQSVPRIRVWNLENKNPEQDFDVVPLPAHHALCRITPGVNREYKSSRLRFSISTPLVPEIVYDYDLETRKLSVLKETRVLDEQTRSRSSRKSSKTKSVRLEKEITSGALDIDRFVCRREFVTSHGGVHVPLTLIHRRDLSRDGQNPTLLMGYGAYGNNLEADFELEHLSLLERGWVIAMAHVRGGGELGLRWYHDGKQLRKMNTFHDFVSCTNHVLDQQYTNPSRLAGKGVSAGGLIMGYMANNHPELFQAMILKVPFVDILETMQDPTLPLTVHEYDEWGNPSLDCKALEYIQQYSPCANLNVNMNMNGNLNPETNADGASYPSMFVTGSMNDIRVQFWEPVKWIHRLRRLHAAQHTQRVQHNAKDATKPPLFLLKMSEEDGHFGGGGRLEQLQETAMEYAFLYHSLKLPFEEAK